MRGFEGFFEFRGMWGDLFLQKLYGGNFLKKGGAFDSGEKEALSSTPRKSIALREKEFVAEVARVISHRLDVYSDIFQDASFEVRLEERLYNILLQDEAKNGPRGLNFEKFGKELENLDLDKEKPFNLNFSTRLYAKKNLLKFSGVHDSMFNPPKDAAFGELLCGFIKVPSYLDGKDEVELIESELMSSGAISLLEQSAEISLPETFTSETLLVFMGVRYLGEYGEYMTEHDSMRCIGIL